MEDFKDWIGHSVVRDDIATPRLLGEYRATLAPNLFEAGDQTQCPPGFHWALAPAMPGSNELGPDGSEAKGLFLPPIPLPRRMWAGGSIETLMPISIGAHIRRTSTIADIKFREGKSGALYVLSVGHDLEANGVLAVRERQDLVFRAADSTPGISSRAEAPLDGLRWDVDATPTLLFRFSAITFNGHRIHYDTPYAHEEGYPGLVVHGPMQAALMFNQLSVLRGSISPRFDYRCVAPLFGGKNFIVSAGWDNGSAIARITRHDGITTAEGRVPALGT